MRCVLPLLLLLLGLVATPAAEKQSVKIKKVLVHLLDREGKHFLSPSLYERDAYQARLRQNRAEQGGLRFDVHWKVRRPTTLTMQVEVRGSNDQKATQDRFSKLLVQRPAGSHWVALQLEGDAYHNFGQLTAWRVTIWDGGQLLAEQTSFLW